MLSSLLKSLNLIWNNFVDKYATFFFNLPVCLRSVVQNHWSALFLKMFY